MPEPHGAPYDHHVQWSLCPHCGALQDGVANMSSDRPPDEGDISMCFECGNWAVFQADGSRVVMPPDHPAWDDPEVQRATAAYRMLREMHPERWPNG